MEWLLSGRLLVLLSISPPGWGGSLLFGLVHSIEVAAGSYLLGLCIGVAGAYGKVFGGSVSRDLLAVYTTITRGVPELILILIMYYAFPQFLNDALTASGYPRIEMPPLLVGVLVLGVVLGAYMTEVMRGAILALPQGQIEAAKAFGMPAFMIARRIAVRHVLASAIPGMSNLWLNVTKDTALLAVIGFDELTLITKQAAGSTKAYFTFFFAAGALYMVISSLSQHVFSRLEHWARGRVPASQGGSE